MNRLDRILTVVTLCSVIILNAVIFYAITRPVPQAITIELVDTPGQWSVILEDETELDAVTRVLYHLRRPDETVDPP